MQQDPNGIGQHAPGAKLDAGKEPMRLILHAMPRALLAVGQVGAYGPYACGSAFLFVLGSCKSDGCRKQQGCQNKSLNHFRAFFRGYEIY